MSKDYTWGTGRRKSSVARVRITPGAGKIEINAKDYRKYFSSDKSRMAVFEPLRITSRHDKYDIFCTVTGGGITGQAGAIRHGISRALLKAEPELNVLLKSHKLLTRDPRMKERKKYGLHGARRGQQYSKR